MKIILQKHFTDAGTKNFLQQISFIFSINNSKVKGFILDLHHVRDMSLLGQLLIYKFISYTSTQKCFDSPLLIWNDIIQKEFVSKGFLDIIETYVNYSEDTKKILKSYKKMKVTTDNFLFAPHRMLRHEEGKRDQLEQEFLYSLNKYFSNDKKKCSVVAQCISELIGNFWAHAEEESETIIVASGNQNSIEVIFADNARGIPNTLKDSNQNYRNCDNCELIRISCNQGVTSKAGTSHQGYGLFLVKELVINNNGLLSLYSCNGYVQFGSKKVKEGEIGFWQGTIIHLRMDLSECKGLEDVSPVEIDERFKWI